MQCLLQEGTYTLLLSNAQCMQNGEIKQKEERFDLLDVEQHISNSDSALETLLLKVVIHCGSINFKLLPSKEKSYLQLAVCRAVSLWHFYFRICVFHHDARINSKW